MLYRKLGKTGLTPSVLGFGAMRLPLAGGIGNSAERFDPSKEIDEELALKMFQYALDHGVNYFDSAYVYHGGKSEVVMGKALKPYRDKVTIVTKLPTMIAASYDDFERCLNEQLTRLDTDYIDLYLVHALDKRVWPRMKELGVVKFLEKIKADGRVRHIGFSFHDDVRAFKEIVDDYDWETCQIQYNYFDENNQAGKEGLLYAAAKGLGISIMEPIRGGKLAGPIPDKIKAIWDKAQTKRTPAEWALRWVWNHPEVSVVLSGMSSMEQVVENIRIADEGKAQSLSAEELALIGEAKKAYEDMMKVGCTGCAYCMPCETGVNIPVIFSSYNDLFIFENERESSAMFYNIFLPQTQRASACIECGACEEKCPQHIEIREELKKAHELLHRDLPPMPGH